MVIVNTLRMKKVVAFAFLLFASTADAEWMILGASANGDSTLYWENSIIQRSGDYVKMWKLANYSSPMPQGNVTYSSYKDFSEYDCKKKKFRYLSASFYSKNMGKGEVLYRDDKISNWISIQSDTFPKAALEIACQQK